jgi:hypothetical protein
MVRRSTKKGTADLDDEATKRILSALLNEFNQRQLTTADLHKTYEGLSPAQLKTHCCVDGNVTEVDFDLAMQDLSQDDLVKTGPLEPYPNDPGSNILVLMFFSKNEYSYLTEDGYKAATKIKAPRRPRPSTPNIHISGNTFQGSQIGIGGNVSQTGDILAASPQQLFERTRAEIGRHISDGEKRALIVAKLNELETAADKPSKMERYNQFVSALGDHITVLNFILPPLLHWLMA